MKKSGFYRHVHHDVLVEWCYDYDARVDYIRKNKPAEEVELRLRLFQPVKGQLPQAYAEVQKARVEAEKVYDEACNARDEAEKVYDEAWEARDEAEKVYAIEITALHKGECPDCPWDGETIFPVKAAEAAGGD